MSMNDKDKRQEAALVTFFAAARASAPEPSAGLMARILAEAEAAQAEQAAARKADPSRPRAGRWRRGAQGLGGWPVLAGLATAGVAGVWIGGTLPATLPGLGSGTGDYVVDIAPELAVETGGEF